jgi:subtilisin-like proprotein convertase family protein
VIEGLESRRLLTSVVVGANVNISRSTTNEAEADIAVNPTNTNQVFAVSNVDGASGLRMTYSNDGGVNWTSRVGANGADIPSACCDARVHYDSFGNLYMVYLGPSGNNLYTARSTNNGQTFTLVNTQTGNWDNPAIDVGANNQIIIQATNSGQVAVVSQSLGLGSTGSFSQQRIAGVSGGGFGDAVVLNDGSFLYTYHASVSGQGPATLPIWRDPDGTGPLPWTQVTSFSTNVGGFDFIPAQNGRSIDSEPEFDVAPAGTQFAGRVYLTYTQETSNENNDTNVVLRYSDNGGVTWSSEIRVNDDTTTRSQFLQSIEVDPVSGVVALVWHDSRNDGGVSGNGSTNSVANDDAQFWGAVSYDGGITFENFLIGSGVSNSANANSSTDYGDWTGLDFYNGVLHGVWADNSTVPQPAITNRPTFDLATARVLVSTTPIFGVFGNVYNDLNGNGARDASETGRIGATVYLDTDDNNQFDAGEPSTLTDSAGVYQFTGLAVGTYTVRTVVGANGVITQPASGEYSVTITASSTLATNINFGVSAPAIRGSIYSDANANATRDAGETGLAGVTVYLDVDNSNSLNAGDVSVLSNAQGDYAFDPLTFGSYVVRVVVPTNSVLTQPASGLYAVTLSTGALVAEGRVFGVVQPFVTGLVFDDANANGVQDAGEAALQNVQVYDDVNNNSSRDPSELAVNTNASGVYNLAPLALGSHTIRVTVPTGRRITAPAGGSYSVTLATGSYGASARNFALTTTARVEGVVYVDANNNGSRDPGEAVRSGEHIFLDLNNNGAFDNIGGTVNSTNVPLAVPPSGTTGTTNSTLSVTTGGTITGLTVQVNLSHSYMGDLDIFLIHPDGTQVQLFDQHGAGGDNLTNTVFSDAAGTAISAGSAPFTGTFRPVQPLSNLNSKPANGIWTLRFVDNFSGDSGTLNSWSITYGSTEPNQLTDASGAFAFDALPANTYNLRMVAPTAPFVFATPADGLHVLTASAGTLLARDFGVRDSTALNLLSAEYQFDAPTPRCVITFSATPVIDPGDLVLNDLTNGTVVPASSYVVTVAGNVATMTFPGLANTSLPNGRYRLDVTAGVTGTSGGALNNPEDLPFHVLAGDFDRDADVDFDDLLIVAQNYGQSGRPFSLGNADYSADGLVGFDDLLLVAQGYQTSVVRSQPREARKARFSDTVLA